jgi:hypothetical protein
MGSYYLIDEHRSQLETALDQLNPESTQYLSVNPHWILLIIRFKEPITSSKQRLSHRTQFNTGDVSQDSIDFSLTATKTPIVISSSCVSMDISSSKSSYVQNLNAALKAGRVDFTSAIMPGDWCAAWTMNTKEKYQEVLKKIREVLGVSPRNDEAVDYPAKLAPNGFEDGLKFIGRVQTIREVKAQTPSGLRTVQYNLSATSFGELNSSTFFDPALARKETYLGRFLADLGIPMESIFAEAAKAAKGQGGVSINKIIPTLLTAFLGKGITGISTGTQSQGLPLAAGASIATAEAPFSYVIPDGIAALLGVSVASKGAVFCYADILELIQGLQKYTQGTVGTDIFLPDGTLLDSSMGGRHRNRHFTSKELKGIFLPTPTSFNGKAVWNLLNEYLNPAINEMYTAMKWTPSNRVMPTLVVRQLPFSSPILHNQLGDEVTSYHELPRWVVDPILVRSIDIGRSDGMRSNFVHIYGESDKKILGGALAYQMVNWPPIADPADAKRHGLRPHIGTVKAAAIDTTSTNSGPGLWMTIKADFMLGQHMMLNGQASLFGVTLPIAPGDNFEFDGILFHIESVNHHVEVSPAGNKTFTTQLSLTHGMRADVDVALEKFSPTRKKVKGKGHIKKSMIDAGDEAAKNEKTKQDFNNRYGEENLENARSESQEGFELEVGTRGENLDIYLYARIDPDDSQSFGPGLLVVDEDD